MDEKHPNRKKDYPPCYTVQTPSHTLVIREVLRLVHREFVHVGDNAPEIAEQEYPEFLLQLQKAILASLKKRELLNHSQYRRCLDEIEKQYCRKKGSQD